MISDRKMLLKLEKALNANDDYSLSIDLTEFTSRIKISALNPRLIEQKGLLNNEIRKLKRLYIIMCFVLEMIETEKFKKLSMWDKFLDEVETEIQRIWKFDESGEDLFTEEDLSYCEIEIGTALESEKI